MKATAPWSPLTHELWGHRQRALAAELCTLGYLLAYSPSINSSAFACVWIWHVMPQVLCWSPESQAETSCAERASRGARAEAVRAEIVSTASVTRRAEVAAARHGIMAAMSDVAEAEIACRTE